MTEVITDAWRRRFKRRLAAAVRGRWGTPAKAIAARAATKSLYRWLDPDDTTVPGADDLWKLCQAAGVPADAVLRDSTDGDASTIHEAWRALAPDMIPEWLRERVGGLVGLVGADLRLTGRASVDRATRRLLTASIAELRRARHEPHARPDEMLAKLRAWKGAEAVEDYLLATLAALRVIVHPGRRIRTR